MVNITLLARTWHQTTNNLLIAHDKKCATIGFFLKLKMILIFRFMSNEIILVSIVSVNVLLFLLFGDI